MDFESLIEAVLHFFKYSENLGFVLYATVAAVLTYVCKRFWLDKVKSQLFQKFKPSLVAPFVFALCLTLFDLFAVRKLPVSSQFLYTCLLDTATIGALATVLLKIVCLVSGYSLSQLLKDDVFALLCNQVTYFSQLREKLKSGQVSLAEFVKQINHMVSQAEQIYKDNNLTPEQKQEKLSTLLTSLNGEQPDKQTVEFIHNALLEKFKDSQEE